MGHDCLLFCMLRNFLLLLRRGCLNILCGNSRNQIPSPLQGLLLSLMKPGAVSSLRDFSDLSLQRRIPCQMWSLDVCCVVSAVSDCLITDSCLCRGFLKCLDPIRKEKFKNVSPFLNFLYLVWLEKPP